MNTVKYHDMFSDQLFPIELVFIEWRSYYNSVQTAIKKSAEEFKNNLPKIFEEIEEQARKMNEDAKGGNFAILPGNQYSAIMYTEGWVIHDRKERTYPKHFRSFFLVQLYNFIEAELKHISHHVYVLKNASVSPTKFINENLRTFSKTSNDKSNLKMSYLLKYMSYLAYIFKFDIKVFQGEIDHLELVALIRNKILHDSGVVKKGTSNSSGWQKLKHLSDKKKYIKLEQQYNKNHYKIEMEDDELIDDTIETGTIFF